MRLKLFITCFLAGCVSVFAQAQQTISYNKTPQAFKGYDMTNYNRPKPVENPFLGNAFPQETAASRSSELEVEPIGSIDKRIWGEINNFNTGGEVLYASERIGNEFHVTTYNNDIEEVENFSVTVPANANQTEVLSHYSTNFFSNDGLGEFIIYVHYFDEELSGPESQIWEIWVVNANGEILQQLEGFAAIAKVDAEGNHRLFTYFEEVEEQVIINSFDVNTWEVAHNYEFSWTLINYFMGAPFDFITVDGQEYVVIARYKHLFMDNMTLEVFPDNNLIVKLLDLNLQEVKTMSLDIQTRYPEAGEFTIPMAQFGMFYRDHTYDISSNIFNTDEKLEVVYGIYYYDMIADNEWSTYLVANEDGDVLHELTEYIIDSFTEMKEVEGADNQLAFLMGADGMATQLGFFNIESWEFDHVFDALTNGDQLSANFNRIATNDSFNYLIGLGEPDEMNGNIYGVVGEYSRNGEMVERHQFLLPETAILFTPILTRYALTDQLFMPTDDLYFMYVYKEMDTDGLVFNNVVITKEVDAPLVEFKSNAEKGSLVGSTFLTDGNGTLDKITMQYETPEGGWLTDVYQLPFERALNVANPTAKEFVFYPNPTNGVVTIDAAETINNIQVYDMLGKIVVGENFQNGSNQFDFSTLKAGIYIAKLTFADGKSQQVKFIKR